jgi:hypothetical protein
MVDIDGLRVKYRLGTIFPLDEDKEKPGWLQTAMDARRGIMNAIPALLDELEALRTASIALRDDLLNRAEWDDDAVKVVCAGNSAWRNFNEAIDN